METIRLKYSFLSLIQYNKDTQTLFLTLAKGKQYKHEGFTESDWIGLKLAKNKGSYISINVLSGENAIQGEYVRTLNASEINRITNFQKYLAI